LTNRTAKPQVEVEEYAATKSFFIISATNQFINYEKSQHIPITCYDL